MLSGSKILPFQRSRRAAGRLAYTCRPALREHRDAAVEIVAESPVLNIHVGAHLWLLESFFSPGKRLWIVEHGGEIVGLIQHCRGISWATREEHAEDPRLIDALAGYLVRQIRHSEVLMGSSGVVEPILEICRVRGLRPIEIRHQEMMATAPRFRPQLPPTKTAFALRAAEPDDLPWLLDSHARMCLEDLGIDQVGRNTAGYTRYFRELISEGDVFVGEANGRPIFKAETPLQADGARLIEGVYTWPEARGQGFASRAVMALTVRAARGGRQACLYVQKRNEAARRIYARLGYRHVAPWTTAILSTEERAPLRPVEI